MNDWMIEIPYKINNSRKKKSRSYNFSLYKENKIGVHITINGKGRVARLMRKK